jgi:hypothetical protein
MAVGLRGSTQRRHKDKILFDPGFFRSRRRLRALLRIRVIGVLLLRLSHVLKVGVMRLNAEALPLVQTPENFVIQKPKVYKEIKRSRDTRRIFKLD